MIIFVQHYSNIRMYRIFVTLCSYLYKIIAPLHSRLDTLQMWCSFWVPLLKIEDNTISLNIIAFNAPNIHCKKGPKSRQNMDATRTIQQITIHIVVSSITQLVNTFCISVLYYTLVQL